MNKKRVVLIGLDSITPVMVERFLAEGAMPNLQRLRERGWSAEIIPTMPPTTPAGWATVATGAWPSTHGVEGFAVHQAGDPLDQKRHSCDSEAVHAEFIWQAAEKAQKKTVLLKYPMSWPPRGGSHLLQVDGAGGWGGLKCVWDLAHSACWDTTVETQQQAASEENVGNEEWLTRDQDNLDEETVNRLEISPPEGWTSLPAEVTPLWETRLVLREKQSTQESCIYILAVSTSTGEGIYLTQSKETKQLELLQPHQWSQWFLITFPTQHETRTGHVRLKVMKMDLSQKQLRLYQTQVHQADGYTRPAGVAQELLEVAGPFVEWTESYDRLQGWIDDDTQCEIYEQHVEWMSKAAGHLLKQHEWDLFMTQVHFIDMAYHIYWGAVDPGHPHYDAEKAPIYWKLLRHVHELADTFLGAILDAIDEDTLLVVLGDHGHDLYHTSFMANHLLLQEGLLAVYRNPRNGQTAIDWKHTSAFASSYRIFLNIAERDPQGIVSLKDYPAVQEKIVQALYRTRDERTGEAPVRLALRREDAGSLGLYGSSMGDIVFAMAPGFQTRSSIQIPRSAWVGQRLQEKRVPLFRPTTLFRDFTGEHDTSLPLTRSIHTLLFIAGQGVAPNRRTTVPVRMVDIAPTLCHYLDIPYPEQCEGNSFLPSILTATH